MVAASKSRLSAWQDLRAGCNGREDRWLSAAAAAYDAGMADILPFPQPAAGSIELPAIPTSLAPSSRLLGLRKVLRYTRLYGPSRTLAKVRAKAHLKRSFETLPPSSRPTDPKQSVALVGCGNYAHCTLAYYLRRAFGDVLAGTMDLDADRAASLAVDHRAPFHTTQVRELLALDNLSMAVIASNHASHTPYAIDAMRRGLDVYIEKPHATTRQQLDDLLRTFDQTGRRIYLGFNRPGSRLGQRAIDTLRSEDGPAMLSWFIAGHKIAPDHWYMRPGEGGRVLGNLCHWTDFCLRAVGSSAFPVRVVPTRAAQPDINCVVSLHFADGSIASLTFSEKEPPMDGVRETLVAQRGHTLLRIEDFDRLVIDRGPKRTVVAPLFRDHGHRANVERAYRGIHEQAAYDRREHRRHLRQTALLFLGVRDALDENRTITIHDNTSIGMRPSVAA